jgi:hypothetical protein
MQSEVVSSADVANMMQGLLDRQAIQDVISCYSLGQDSHQGEDSAILQQWEETFSETGTVDYSAAGGTVGSYRDLAKWMRGDENTSGSMSGFSNWQHMLSLPVVSIAGDTAHARTDFFATHRGRADQAWNVHYNASGAFHDDLVRTPQGWRIQFRRLEVYFGDPLEIAKTALVVVSPSLFAVGWSPTRPLLIGKQDAGFVRKTLKFCDDLTFDEYGANTCRRNWP